jgi:hypothetical protein
MIEILVNGNKDSGVNFTAFTSEMHGFGYHFGRDDGPRNFRIRIITVNQTGVVLHAESTVKCNVVGKYVEPDWNPAQPGARVRAPLAP